MDATRIPWKGEMRGRHEGVEEMTTPIRDARPLYSLLCAPLPSIHPGPHVHGAPNRSEL